MSSNTRGWREPQDLETAFRRSTVWVFRSLAARIPDADYRRWLTRFDYGNREIGRDRDDFWLAGPLAISVREQVAFLAGLVQGEFGVSARTLHALDRAARQRVDFPFDVYGKTGAGPLAGGDLDGPFEGWFVGYLRAENGSPVAAFALYAQARNFRVLRDARRTLALALMRRSLDARARPGRPHH